MCKYFASFCVFHILVCFVTSVPLDNLTDNFRNVVHHQDLQTILGSIEERLRNLDNIYSMHLSPTLEEKLDNYQRKLESLDVKIIRLETLVMLNLDQMSENMSAKNFKDDMTHTEIEKKIDSVYEGLNHKLSYIERKLDIGTIKVQNKLEITLNRIEKMEESFATRDEYIAAEISDAIAAVDDLKASCLMMEENIVNNTNENFEVALKEHAVIVKNYNDKFNSLITKQYHNITTSYSTIDNTQRFLKDLKHDIQADLNEYAIKVAEMNAANWESRTIFTEQQEKIQNQLNLTREELHKNAIVGNDNSFTIADQEEMERLNEKIDVNFEKVYEAQNLFLDSCYRLQMDESQIESKISDILEKLMETFEEKTAIETKDIENLARIIKNHDSHTQRNLHQIRNNVNSIYDKICQDYRLIEMEFKRITEYLKIAIDGDDKINNQEILQEIKNINNNISSLNNHSLIIENSLMEIKLLSQNSENTTEKSEVIQTVVKNNIDELILEIFGTPPTDVDTTNTNEIGNSTELNFIDVRGGIDN